MGTTKSRRCYAQARSPVTRQHSEIETENAAVDIQLYCHCDPQLKYQILHGNQASQLLHHEVLRQIL